MSKKFSQRAINPYKFTDSNKRYYTYDYYLRKTFGGKCAKIPIDAGFTCPNIDGRCGIGGCIYCSSRGSGDFAERAELSVSEQYEITRQKLSSKWSVDICIPYFQAHRNTYAPIEVLREKFEEAIALPGAVGLNIATRADCIEEWLVLLWVLVAAMIFKFYSVCKWASFINIPYFLWVTFALYLNFMIYRLNV